MNGGRLQRTSAVNVFGAIAGIRVNAVRPGIVRTGIHGSGGQPDRLERIAL